MENFIITAIVNQTVKFEKNYQDMYLSFELTADMYYKFTSHWFPELFPGVISSFKEYRSILEKIILSGLTFPAGIDNRKPIAIRKGINFYKPSNADKCEDEDYQRVKAAIREHREEVKVWKAERDKVKEKYKSLIEALNHYPVFKYAEKIAPLTELFKYSLLHKEIKDLDYFAFGYMEGIREERSRKRENSDNVYD